MAFVGSLISAVWLRIGMLASGLSALVTLLARVISASRTDAGNLGQAAAKVFSETPNVRRVFSVSRLLAPNLVLSKKFVTAYENTGTAIVTRADDVFEVLDREADFEVVYEPKMRAITGGENFFLGMQDSARYQRDVSNMRIAVRRTDVAERLVPLTAAHSREIVDAAAGVIDVPADLTRRVPAIVAGDYFGTPGPSEARLIDWTSNLFWYLFIDLVGEERITTPALASGRELCAYLDATIAARKANPSGGDDIIDRCLAMQASGLPGMDDLTIRNNLFGLLIGFVPTLSRACVQALNVLLDRPYDLAGAQKAARADNDALVGAYLFEALRFDPINPVIYRRCVADTRIARGTARSRRIPKGTMVLAANLSAMFDPLRVDAPENFDTNRPWETYILWGYGMHTCFGAHINRAIIPQIMKPLLKLKNLRRVPGPEGLMDGSSTPFPHHMKLAFDR